jgi:hypothetical protein
MNVFSSLFRLNKDRTRIGGKAPPAATTILPDDADDNVENNNENPSNSSSKSNLRLVQQSLEQKNDILSSQAIQLHENIKAKDKMALALTILIQHQLQKVRFLRKFENLLKFFSKNHFLFPSRLKKKMRS